MIRIYLVFAFRMRTSAPSRAILVRRFTQTETLTFLSGTGTFTVTHHLQHQVKRKFLSQEMIRKKLAKFEATSNEMVACGFTDLSPTS